MYLYKPADEWAPAPVDYGFSDTSSVVGEARCCKSLEERWDQVDVEYLEVPMGGVHVTDSGFPSAPNRLALGIEGWHLWEPG
jgi:hypothetical protein